MNRKVQIFFSLISLALIKCEPPVQYGAPANSYGTPNYDGSHDGHEYGEPKSYEFGYQVKDDYSGNNYKRQEVSDGNQVRGEYRVQLPDGRTQIVTYYADWQTGFHADVRYEGEASFPETYKNNYAGVQNNYNQQQQYGGGNSPATSSVSIKDYSGPATPYSAGGNHNNNNNYGNGYQNGYDSYPNHGGPSNAYGTPYK